MDQRRLALLNQSIDPLFLLESIAYKKSSPQSINEYVRDFCPIHKGESQKSLSINKNTHLYRCHSCGETGNLIDLYAKSMKINFGEAIKALSHFYGSEVRDHTPKQMTKKFEPQNLWAQASEEGDHPYLKKKKIKKPPGIRFGMDPKGNASIVVPFYEVAGRLKTLQYINDFGKFFLGGCPMQGAFFPLGQIKDKTTVYVVEGLATATTIWQALEEATTVIAAGSTWNLGHVFDAIKKKYKNMHIVFAMDQGDAPIKALLEIKDAFDFCRPCFKTLASPAGQTPNDFNDIVSICNQKISVVKCQLKDIKSSILLDMGRVIGNLTNDQNFANCLQSQSRQKLSSEDHLLFGNSHLTAGYVGLDYLRFYKQDLVVVQGMTNHGKTTFMLQLAYKFLSLEENQKINPMCIYITFESHPIQLRKKFLHIIGHESGEGTVQNPFKQNDDYPKTTAFYDFVSGPKCLMHVLKPIPLEGFGELIDMYQSLFPSRTQILFLDYFQIITNQFKGDGWEKIKSIAVKLEQIAKEKNIVIFVGSQVNECRIPREGLDIANSATTIIDIINRSHTSLKINPRWAHLYTKGVAGKDVCQISVQKRKNGERKEPIHLFFNGFFFEEIEEEASSKKPLNGKISYEFAYE